MSNYRRANVPGGTVFFTHNLHDRTSTLLVDQIDALRHAIAWTKRRHPFRMDALVILPDHLHAIWTLPEGDINYASRWRIIKTRFSRGLEKTEPRSANREKRGERGIWQRRYWEHTIQNDRDFQNCLAYCYNNPLNHRLVETPSAWPHSTYRRDVRLGCAENDDVGVAKFHTGFGEATDP